MADNPHRGVKYWQYRVLDQAAILKVTENMSTEPMNNLRKITTVPRLDARKVKVGYEDGEGQLHGRSCTLGSSKICHYLTPQ